MAEVEPSSSRGGRLPTQVHRAAWWRTPLRMRAAARWLRDHPERPALAGIYLFCLIAAIVPFTSLTRVFAPDEAPSIAQAQSWWAGRLDLPERIWDTALYEGRVYAVQPPAYSLIAAAILPWSPAGVPRWALLVLLALPGPALALALFRRRVRSLWVAVVLTLGFVCGTSFAPVVVQSLVNGNVYTVSAAISTLGLLLFLVEFFGNRRVWVMGVGLVVAVWARQLTIFYFAPFAWAAWNGPGMRGRRMAAAAGLAVLTAAFPMALNALKFGHPLEFGYRYLYVNRDDSIARDAAHGVFSPRFVPRNLYYMNLGLPVIRHYPRGDRLEANYECTGIWWTSPILILLLVHARDAWRRPEHRVVLAGAAFAFAALTLYHATGSAQYGHNRYSLDYLPGMFAVMAPSCEAGWRRWCSTGCVLWSALYFCRLIAV